MDTAAPKDFFISYTHADQRWAEWIAWQLEAEGYTTVLQAWDFLPGSNFVLDMDQVAQQASRTIALLSPDYLASHFTPSEWASAFAQDPTSQQGKLLPIRVRACMLTGLLAQLVFIGRELVLSQLHKLLHAGTTAALSQPPAISGLGGIGKTQTAVEYAYRFRDDYQFVLWVQANSQETLLADFVTLAKQLNLPEQNEQEQQVVAHAVLQWLENHRRWLLIFDNADDLAIMQDYLPQGNQGHILFTTRAQAMAGLARKVELETMDSKEGTMLLLRRAGLLIAGSTLEGVSMADREQARLIVQEMGGLPLALDQAGAYLEETEESLSNYPRLYQEQRATLLKRRGGIKPPHPESVATTWSLALQQVQREQRAAIEFMRLCAFLAPDAIPEELIVEGAAYLGPVLQPIAADRGRFNEALAALLKYSMLRRDIVTHTLVIHRLVQAVILDELDKKTQRRWVERVVQAVRQVFPYDEPAPWPRSQRYLAQALVCETLITHWNLVLDESTGVLNNAGCYLLDRGQYRAAEPLLRYALATGEKKYGIDHPNTYYLLGNSANLYFGQGKYEEAESLYRRALAIYEQTLGPEHLDTQRIRENHTALLEKMKQIAEFDVSKTDTKP